MSDTWTCDKCGGTWPNPHFDNPDLQAEFDAVTTCVHCVSLAMAKKRIGELEAANLKWKFALEGLTPGGSEFVNDPEFCAQWVRNSRQSDFDAIKRIKKQRDELESAQQWHDMDDLPLVDDSGHAKFEVVVDGCVTIGIYNDYRKIPWHDEMGTPIKPTLWRDLPPTPEVNLMQPVAEPELWRCTVCGRVGSVGRCCGHDTRQPMPEGEA